MEWIEDPDDYLEGVTETYWKRQSMRLMKRFPKVGLSPPRGLSALYDVTVEDWYPIVDRTDLPGYYVCIGTSGSSFKTSAVLAMLMVKIIEECESGKDIDRDPVQLILPRTNATVDASFLSRSRGKIKTSGTVIG